MSFLHKTMYLFNLQHRRELKKIQAEKAARDLIIKDLQKEIIVTRAKNKRLSTEMKKNRLRNVILLEKYNLLLDIVKKEKYKILQDYKVIQGGIDELERALEKNEKQEIKIDNGHKKYLVTG